MEFNEQWKNDIVTQFDNINDVGDLSDGYHTYNQLYHQRAILFAVIVDAYKDKAWKSLRHDDGNYCFDSDGKWFIVGIDTPNGQYTYHYEKDKYWLMFDCKVLDKAPKWDGHTEANVGRLFSLKKPIKNGILSQYREMMKNNQYKI